MQLVEYARTIEALGYGDASVGWFINQSNVSSSTSAAAMPHETASAEEESLSRRLHGLEGALAGDGLRERRGDRREPRGGRGGAPEGHPQPVRVEPLLVAHAHEQDGAGGEPVAGGNEELLVALAGELRGGEGRLEARLLHARSGLRTREDRKDQQVGPHGGGGAGREREISHSGVPFTSSEACAVREDGSVYRLVHQLPPAPPRPPGRRAAGTLGRDGDPGRPRPRALRRGGPAPRDPVRDRAAVQPRDLPPGVAGPRPRRRPAGRRRVPDPRRRGLHAGGQGARPDEAVGERAGAGRLRPHAAQRLRRAGGGAARHRAAASSSRARPSRSPTVSGGRASRRPSGGA